MRIQKKKSMRRTTRRVPTMAKTRRPPRRKKNSPRNRMSSSRGSKSTSRDGRDLAGRIARGSISRMFNRSRRLMRMRMIAVETKRAVKL